MLGTFYVHIFKTNSELNWHVEHHGHAAICHDQFRFDQGNTVHLRQWNTIDQITFENLCEKFFIGQQTHLS